MGLHSGSGSAGLLDIDGASPRRFFFEVLSHFAEEPTEKQRLLYLSSSQGREEMALYNRKSGRSFLFLWSRKQKVDF